MPHEIATLLSALSITAIVGAVGRDCWIRYLAFRSSERADTQAEATAELLARLDAVEAAAHANQEAIVTVAAKKVSADSLKAAAAKRTLRRGAG